MLPWSFSSRSWFCVCVLHRHVACMNGQQRAGRFSPGKSLSRTINSGVQELYAGECRIVSNHVHDGDVKCTL